MLKYILELHFPTHLPQILLDNVDQIKEESIKDNNYPLIMKKIEDFINKYGNEPQEVTKNYSTKSLASNYNIKDAFIELCDIKFIYLTITGSQK